MEPKTPFLLTKTKTRFPGPLFGKKIIHWLSENSASPEYSLLRQNLCTWIICAISLPLSFLNNNINAIVAVKLWMILFCQLSSCKHSTPWYKPIYKHKNSIEIKTIGYEIHFNTNNSIWKIQWNILCPIEMKNCSIRLNVFLGDVCVLVQHQ